MSQAMATLQVMVPPGVKAGQEMDVPTPDGQTMRVTVPPGIGPGQVITMQYVPKATPAPPKPKPNPPAFNPNYQAASSSCPVTNYMAMQQEMQQQQQKPYGGQQQQPYGGHQQQPYGGYQHKQTSGGDGFSPSQLSANKQTYSGACKRKALLIGCNYRGQRGELRGCINDTLTLKNMLLNVYNWNSSDIRILTDETRNCLPTRANILSACKALVSGAAPGDAFFFSFSGHGAQKVDPNGYEEDGMNETVLPLDFSQSGMITDDELNECLVKNLPSGCKLTAILDACHSGTGLDLPFTWTQRGWKEETNPFHTAGDVVMLSGCSDDDVSADASQCGVAGGAMTEALNTVIQSNRCPSYHDLLPSLHRVLQQRGFRQRPVLTSSQRFDFSRRFQIDGDALPNSNQKLGRTFRRKFTPSPNKRVEKFMNDMGLDMFSAAIIGAGLLQMAAGFFFD